MPSTLSSDDLLNKTVDKYAENYTKRLRLAMINLLDSRLPATYENPFGGSSPTMHAHLDAILEEARPVIRERAQNTVVQKFMQVIYDRDLE